MPVYVIIHGAWHSGPLFEPVAEHIRAEGHEVHCPTVAGNRPGDSRRTGLETAISSIAYYLEAHDLRDVILCGQSYGGMIITGVADRLPRRVRRLVYCNAFVPNDGECMNDMVPQNHISLFANESAVSGDNSIMLPFPLWREAFINDGSMEQAKAAYEQLNAHPYATFTDRISLKTNPADMEIGKSYVNCTEDTALPSWLGWHPRLSSKLGLFRLVQIPGSHELCFTDPGAFARAIMMAGRD